MLPESYSSSTGTVLSSWHEEPKEDVHLGRSLHSEPVKYAGWLWKDYSKAPHRRWRRMWFFLLQDRLCYTADPAGLEAVEYIPLDRIPVRPLPRGYHPHVGVMVTDGYCTPASATSWTIAVFSVQCGLHTHIMAAGTHEEAQEWVEQITDVWFDCIKEASRSFIKSSADLTALKLLDCVQHLEQENRHLCYTNTQLLYSTKAAPLVREAQSLERTCYEVQIVTGDVQGAGANAAASIELYEAGGAACSGTFRLEAVEGSRCPLQKGTISYFQVTCARLQGVHAVALELTSADMTAWFVEDVMVRDHGEGAWVHFPSRTWLSSDGENARCTLVRLQAELQAFPALSSDSWDSSSSRRSFAVSMTA